MGDINRDGSDPVLEQKIEGLRKSMEEGHNTLRNELREKHQQNRSDIHKMRNDMQTITNENHLLGLRLSPIIGNEGRPGKIDELMDSQANQTKNIATISAKMHELGGGIKAFKWWIGTLIVVIGLILTALELTHHSAKDSLLNLGQSNDVYAKQQTEAGLGVK